MRLLGLKLAITHLAYPDLDHKKFSGTDPDQDAESFIQHIEWKVNFFPVDAPGDNEELANYTSKKKTFFSSYLQRPAAEWCENIITNITTWDNVRTNSITRFSDGWKEFQYTLEVEFCVRGDWEENRNFLHCIKGTVDKGWPKDMNGIETAQENTERDTQARERRQRNIDYSLKGLRTIYLQRKPKQQLMENPNARWSDFSTRIIQTDVSIEISSNSLINEERTKVQMITLGKKMKNLWLELQEHRVKVVEGNSRTMDPKPKTESKINTILQIVPYKWTHSKLEP